MLIQQQDDEKHGAFYVEENNIRFAEMTYTWASHDLMIIDHTEVDERLKGKSVGKQLVDRAVELAREKHFKILPLCPFAKAVLTKSASYNDVLK